MAVIQRRRDGTLRVAEAANPAGGLFHRSLGGHVEYRGLVAIRDKGTLTCMNSLEEITPEHAERLVTLLCMMGDLDREALGFLVGHMASRNIDLAIEAYGALMATEIPVEGS